MLVFFPQDTDSPIWILDGRAIKILTGPLARRRCKTTWDLLYMERYTRGKPGLNKGQDCCPCITLHIPLFLYVQLAIYKLLLKIKLWVWHQCLAPPCHSFLPFLAEFPSGAWRLIMSTYLPWLLRPTWEREPKAGHPPLFKRVPVAYVDGAISLSWNFIGFPRKPSYSASLLHLFSYYTISF